MFTIRDFSKRGLFSAVGKLPDYQIILYAIEWYQSGLLTEEDLQQINTKLDLKSLPPYSYATIPEVEPTEESVEAPEEAEEETEEEIEGGSENDNTEIQDMAESSISESD